MAQDRRPLVGDTVTCTYRGEHRGVVLAVDDPRAWPGWHLQARAGEDFAAHVAWCLAQGLCRETIPIMWHWGVMWDRIDAIHVVGTYGHRSESLHVDHGPRGMVDYCDLDCD